MQTRFLQVILAVWSLSAFGAAPGEENKTSTISVWIFEGPLRAAVPGIDSILTLSSDQKQQLAKAYREVFGANEVALANMTLQDKAVSLAKRQTAIAIIRNAEEGFRAKLKTIFTAEQRRLIEQVYSAYNEVYKAAYQEMEAKIRTEFAQRLDSLLSPEQKKTLGKTQAQMKVAQRKQEEQKQSQGKGKPPENQKPDAKGDTKGGK